MLFTTTALLSTLLLASSTLAGPLGLRNSNSTSTSSDDWTNSSLDIFPSADDYSSYAICKSTITKDRFPNLSTPSTSGGCVRYYRGIDMTGVVTMINLFHRDGINSACDCAAACLSRPLTCTNWVFKHTFAGAAIDDNKRSCTLYSSPNLPTGVTLAYDINKSIGTGVIAQGNNPQMGGDAPLTFLDVNNTMVDRFGVSGFMARDTNGLQHC